VSFQKQVAYHKLDLHYCYNRYHKHFEKCDIPETNKQELKKYEKNSSLCKLFSQIKQCEND